MVKTSRGAPLSSSSDTSRGISSNKRRKEAEKLDRLKYTSYKVQHTVTHVEVVSGVPFYIGEDRH